MRVIHAVPSPAKAPKRADGDAVARLAGGVAHEFNNLLTVIGGHAELLLEALPPDHPARASAMEIQKAARSGEQVANQMLAISGRQVLRSARFDLNDAVWGLASRIASILPFDVNVTVELAPGLRDVEGDREQIERAIMNVVTNACNAMPRGGRLAIATAQAHTADGPVAQVTVSDSGCGIAADVRTHVFDPFFSTQPFGTGAGLGLSATRGIIEQSRGSIDLESQPGRGTTVTVSLPMAGLEGTEPPAVEPEFRPSSAIRLPAAASS